MTTQSDLQKRLETLAFKRTTPFCYSCYQRAPSGTCDICHSDDLMRELAGDGVEYGVDWVIESLLRDNLTPLNVEEAFEDSIRECFPDTTTVAWLELDTISIVKEMDPISWQVAQREWESAEEENETIISFDGGTTHYRIFEIERFLDEAESKDISA